MKKTIFICIALISLLFMYAVRDSISFKSKNPFRTSNFGAIDSFRIIDNSISFSDLTDPLVGDLDVTGTISASDSMYGTYAKFSNSIEADSIYGSTYIYSVRLFISDIVCSDSIYAAHLDITSTSRLAGTQFIGDISFSAATFDIGGVTNMVDSLYVEDIISTGNIIMGDAKWIGYGGSEGRLSFDYVNGAQDTLSALGTDILVNTGMIIQTDGSMPVWDHSPTGGASEGTWEWDGTQTYDGISYFYQLALFQDDISLRFGGSNDVYIEWDTAETNDALKMGFDKASSYNFLLTNTTYINTDKSIAESHHPTIIFADSTGTPGIKLDYTGIYTSGRGLDSLFFDIAEVAGDGDGEIRLGDTGTDGEYVHIDSVGILTASTMKLGDDSANISGQITYIALDNNQGTTAINTEDQWVGAGFAAYVLGDSLYGTDAVFSGDVEMDSLYAANAVITLASLTDLVVSDSIYVANLDVTNSARIAATQFIGDISFDAATHNIGGITNHVDSLYLSNLVAASTLAMIGDFQFKGNISFDAATYNIGGITNHVDSLYLSVLSPASILYITDAIQLAGNIGFSAATYDIGGVTNMVDSLYVEDVVSAGVVTIAESLIVADRISFPSGENDIGIVVGDLGTASRAFDLSGSGLATTDNLLYFSGANYWTAGGTIRTTNYIGNSLTSSAFDLELYPTLSNRNVSLGISSEQAVLIGNKTEVGSIADAASRAGEPDLYKASHGLSAAAGDLLHIRDSSTAADEDFYMVVKVTTDSILVTPTLAGTQADVDFAVYQDVIGMFATDGTNGQRMMNYSHQDKPYQIGGVEYEATGHSLGSEDVLIGGTLLEVNATAYLDGDTYAQALTAYGVLTASNVSIRARDDNNIEFGTGVDMGMLWDTNAANDDIGALQFIESDGTNIPILVVSDASFAPDGDSKFDDIVEPSIGFVDDDADSYFRIGFIGDDAPGIVTDGDRFLIEAPSALTNTVQQVLRLSHTTSGTPATNIGVGMEFEVETSSGNNEILAAIEVIATDVGAGAEDGDIVFKTMTAGATATEAMRITSGGDVMVADCLRAENEITLGTDGSASDPGYTWGDDLDTGLYRIGENSFAVTAGNAEILRFSNAEIYASKRLKLLSSAILFSGGDLDFGSGNSTSIKMTLESDGDILLGVAGSSELTPDFSIIGDADSDAPDTDETIALALTQNADPTLATWGWTSTQSAGYTFDKSVTVTGNLSATTYGSDASILDAELLTIDDGAVTEILVGGGAGSAPVWGADIPTAVTIGSAYVYRAGGTDVADADIVTTLTLETISGTPVITNGVRIGTDDTDHLIDDASNGAASATLYIGNEEILASGDIGVLDDKVLQADGNLTADDYTKVTANGLVGRDYSEIIDDIGSSIDETGTVGTGTWNSTIAHGTLTNAVATDLDGNGLITNDTVGEDVGPNDLLHMHSDGKYTKADADSSITMPAVVMAMDSIYANAAGDLLHEGYYRDDSWSWTIGSILYASQTVGAVQDTAATGDDDQTQVIGYAVTATIIYFDPDLTLIE